MSRGQRSCICHLQEEKEHYLSWTCVCGSLRGRIGALACLLSQRLIILLVQSQSPTQRWWKRALVQQHDQEPPLLLLGLLNDLCASHQPQEKHLTLEVT